MTDRELIVEHIQNAVQALDHAHNAGNDLRQAANAEKLQAFRDEMYALCAKLERLKNALDNQAVYGEDELINMLSLAFSGQPTPYRHITEVKRKK
ncbi:MAG: hypothetical protein RBS68_11595 [Anaerolineales bacterium]|jgi:hypothetical protein|nr:hypothetical protein [Anaerolineales bacterium]